MRTRSRAWLPSRDGPIPPLRRALVLALLGCLGTSSAVVAQPAALGLPASYRAVRQLEAPAARQGVAVDAGHVYAIGNHRIQKIDRKSGELVADWDGGEAGPIVHLNSGIVIEGVLHCAHSNYPAVPMLSSIERFDSKTLEHTGSHSFGVLAGSATWVDRRNGHWWVAFANYDGRGGTPGRGTAWTALLELDDEWRRIAGYSYPPGLVDRFAGRSNSGGAWGRDGRLYLTGHDAAELYVVRLPEAGSVLEWVATIPAPIAGQGIAFDPARPGVLWGIVKRMTRILEMQPVGP